VGRRRRRNERPRKERAHLECPKERPRTCHERWVAGGEETSVPARSARISNAPKSGPAHVFLRDGALGQVRFFARRIHTLQHRREPETEYERCAYVLRAADEILP